MRGVWQLSEAVKERKKNIPAPKAVMLNDRNDRKDRTAVRKLSKKILHYWAEPSEESESSASSSCSLGAKLERVCWGSAVKLGRMCRGLGPAGTVARGSIEALGVWKAGSNRPD